MSYSTTATLSDGRLVSIDYDATGGSKAVTSGPPEHCDPGELPEITIRHVYLDDEEGTDVALSDDEYWRLDLLIAEKHEYPDCDDYLED